MCLEFLTHLINKECAEKTWKPVKIDRGGGPNLSHLLFADDIVLFSHATTTCCQSIKRVLHNFCTISGQKVNLSKSIIMFSRNVPADIKIDCCNLLDLTSTDNLGKYLGFPLSSGCPKKSDFSFIIEKVRDRGGNPFPRVRRKGWSSYFVPLTLILANVLQTQAR